MALSLRVVLGDLKRYFAQADDEPVVLCDCSAPMERDDWSADVHRYSCNHCHKHFDAIRPGVRCSRCGDELAPLPGPDDPADWLPEADVDFDYPDMCGYCGHMWAKAMEV